MAVEPSHKVYNLDVFWDDEYKRLDYVHEAFNDRQDVERWLSLGYQPKICGEQFIPVFTRN